ncbi:hypothetical protein K457DRAFT_36880 [Linnemannia elongata AG-77]|uniref:CCHC-type domain-containing protein n=1 Tax=Linnemannia elongata AG-77 TaxID=1314771 RepID=A0A197JCX3_9FUNG|nr:hypothetical protein K457DRAFT_36880 [Linnemannia elongata AG-77]
MPTNHSNNNNSHSSKENRLHPYLARIHKDMNQTYEALQAKIQHSRLQSAQTATSDSPTTTQEPMVLFSAAVESLIKHLNDYQEANTIQKQHVESITNSNTTPRPKEPTQPLTTASITTTTTKRSTTSSLTPSSSSSSSLSGATTPKVGSGGYVALVKGRLPRDERQYRLDHGLCMYCGITKHAVWNCPKLQAKGENYLEHLYDYPSSYYPSSYYPSSYYPSSYYPSSYYPSSYYPSSYYPSSYYPSSSSLSSVPLAVNNKKADPSSQAPSLMTLIV